MARIVELFGSRTGTLSEKAQKLDSLWSTSFEDLDKAVSTAARHLEDYPELRTKELVASAIIDGWFAGGREYISR